MVRLKTPLKKQDLAKLKVGTEVFLTGLIYTARDRAHKRLVELIKKGKKLPLDLNNKIIYYCGPNIKDNELMSAGPTTSQRMDPFLEELLKKGLIAVIGKGKRSDKARELFRKYKSVYFLTYAGCGAYLRKRILRFRLIAFKELGPEAIYEFEVKDFPLIVGIDAQGRDIFKKKGV